MTEVSGWRPGGENSLEGRTNIDEKSGQEELRERDH